MITKEMIIGDIIKQHPETLKVFACHDLECNECQIADLETLEHGANHHKIDIRLLLQELNSALTSSTT